MSRKTFEHRGGQEFEKYVEFMSYGDKKLILAKSNFNIIPVDQVTLMDSMEPKYFSKGHWFVLYGNRGDSELDMGITKLSYPISERTLTLKSALHNFNKMVKNINNVTFNKIDHEKLI